ncbi:MAG: AMIN domain-containing protein [Campylobacterota bacterium]
MKTLFLFTLAVILSTNLNARENPFTTTNAYDEEAARIIESEQFAMNQSEESDYIQRMREKLAVEDEIPSIASIKNTDENKSEVIKNEQKPQKVEEKKKTTKTKEEISNEELKKLIKQAQQETEQRAKQIIEEQLKSSQIKPQEVVFVKPRLDVEEQMQNEQTTLNILPFLDIVYSDNKMDLKSKYSVSKKFSLPKENKLIVDYKAKVNFYTKREELNSKNFKKIAVGNHKKNSFFRVVIQLDSNPSNYEVSYKNDLVSISPSN